MIRSDFVITVAPKPCAKDDLKALSSKPELLFAVHVRIRHGSRAYHGLLPLRTESFVQQLRCILLHLDVLEGMGEVVAFAPAVTVNATMRAPAVYIHPISVVLAGEYSFCVNKMHSKHLSIHLSSRCGSGSVL